jgi:hypothetical protein
VFLAVITDRVIAVIRQHVVPLDTGSAWAPLGRAAIAVLRLAAVVALYLLRTVLAPSSTLRGLRQMVLDAAPAPGMTGVWRACGEPLPYPAHDHHGPEYGSRRPSEDKGGAEVSVDADGQNGDQGAGQPVTGFPTKKAAFLARYRAHLEYGTGLLPDGSPPSSPPWQACSRAPGAPTSPRNCASSPAWPPAHGPAEQDHDQPAG